MQQKKEKMKLKTKILAGDGLGLVGRRLSHRLGNPKPYVLRICALESWRFHISRFDTRQEDEIDSTASTEEPVSNHKYTNRYSKMKRAQRALAMDESRTSTLHSHSRLKMTMSD